ncbi:MAG: hypothetical protein J0M28_17830 [Thauera sp.]|nr:hypothetical protein [Thauera sp.]
MGLTLGEVVQGKIDTVGFTLQGILAAAPGIPEGLEEAAAALRVLTAGEKGGAVALCSAFVRSFDDELHELVSRSAPSLADPLESAPLLSRGAGWRRWVSAVRGASVAVSEAYRCLLPEAEGAPAGELRLKAATRLRESLKWSLIDRRKPDGGLWGDWAALRMVSVATASTDAARQVESEHLVALAHHASALDQLSLPCALAACHLIRLALPFLSISRKWVSGAQYRLGRVHAPIPVRVIECPVDAMGEEYFITAPAVEFLETFAVRLREGLVPGALAGIAPELSLAAIAHLRSLWAVGSRQRRNRRHEVDERIEVLTGWRDSLAALSGAIPVRFEEWKVLDISRSGVRAAARVRRDGGIPELGRLVSSHFPDGTARQVGIVRRVRTAEAGFTDVGIEILSLAPAYVQADDGREAIDVILCDPLSNGEAVRAIGTQRSLSRGRSLYVVQAGKVWKLRPMEFSLQGDDFELRVYQVL